jgi:hypothetical protein
MMRISVQVEPASTAPPAVQYTWDSDTDILSAQLRDTVRGKGMSGSVGLEGIDGSWLILDLSGGRINAVEVAVWPDVRAVSSLSPPTDVEDVSLLVPARKSQPAVASLEVNTPLTADADTARRTFHFKVGSPREARTVRVARDILVDVDERSQIAGLWLLNVPPCPAPT